MSQLRSIMKSLPGVRWFVNSLFLRRLRHRYNVATDPRTTLKTFTRFKRLPRQFDALAGPVIDYVYDVETNNPLKIIVLGCSTGAEVWSIVSSLREKRPNLPFHVFAYDIQPEVLEQAKKGEYSHKEIFTHDQITQDFVSSCFYHDGNIYTVKDDLRDYATFAELDVFTPRLEEIIGTGNIVFAQNFLFNFRPSASKKAFVNIHPVLKERSVLFVEGMDIGQRFSLTCKFNLQPLDYMIEEIHDDARIVRAEGWPCCYWGLEPLDKSRSNWKRFYATIFLKGLIQERKR